jgi:hypothetical protein
MCRPLLGFAVVQPHLFLCRIPCDVAPIGRPAGCNSPSDRPTASTSRSPDPALEYSALQQIPCLARPARFTARPGDEPTGRSASRAHSCPRSKYRARALHLLTPTGVVRSRKMLRGHVEQSLPYASAKFSWYCTRTTWLFSTRYPAYVPILSALYMQPSICRQVG